MSVEICNFCGNSGTHLCPDVSEVIVIPCSKKGCVYGEIARLKQERDEYRATLERIISFAEDADERREIARKSLDRSTKYTSFICDENLDKCIEELSSKIDWIKEIQANHFDEIKKMIFISTSRIKSK